MSTYEADILDRRSDPNKYWLISDYTFTKVVDMTSSSTGKKLYILSVNEKSPAMDCNIVDRQISITPPTSPTAEEHLSTQCRYVSYQVKHPDGYMCYVWLRKCVCGQRADMSDLALTGKIPLIRQDGVDIHLSEACDWEERSFSGRNILKRNCFEEMHVHSPGLPDVNHVQQTKTEFS